MVSRLLDFIKLHFAVYRYRPTHSLFLPCRYCAHECALDARSCPNCGTPNHFPVPSRFGLFFKAVGSLLFGIAMVSVAGYSNVSILGNPSFLERVKHTFDLLAGLIPYVLGYGFLVFGLICFVGCICRLYLLVHLSKARQLHPFNEPPW